VEKRQFLNRQVLKLIGLGFGIAVVVVIAVAMAYAYAEEPGFCGRCHSMEEFYTSWQASSHSTVACSECHLPHDGAATKLVAKTQAGFVDIYHQTLRDYPLQIQITDKGYSYLKDNCLRCHEPVVRDTSIVSTGKDCLSCHRTLVHKTI